MEDKSIIFAFHEVEVRYFEVSESIIRILEDHRVHSQFGGQYLGA
jgi:hypothetical protein